jgi:glycosyltransferase involved in cell wall biosynthesis
MSTVLLIAPYFPPMSVVGAKRPLTMVRHLPAFGWNPVVLTADPTREAVDPALAALVPPDVPVARMYGKPAAGRDGTKRPHRARTRQLFGWDLGYLTPFDRYLWDTPSALRAAHRLIASHRPKAIYVSADPWSPLMAGLILHSRTGLPLIVDLRDPWSLNAAKMALRPPPTRWAVRAAEARVFRAAAKIVLNTEASLDAHRAAYAGRIAEERFTVIRNAFDPELYGPAPPPPGPTGVFEVMYFGHLRPSKNALLFLDGFRRFLDAERLAPGEARLTTLGERTPEDNQRISELRLAPYTRSEPWIPWTESRVRLGRADLLLDLMSAEHQLQISGKLYDYFATGRPILSVTPNDETGRILAETRAGVRVPLEAGAIAGALSAALARKRMGQRFSPDRAALARYEARPAAAKLAAILGEVTG